MLIYFWSRYMLRVVKSTCYLLSLGSIKKSGRHDCDFTRVRSLWYTRVAHEAIRRHSVLYQRRVTMLENTHGSIYRIDSIENHLVHRWRAPSSRRDHKFGLLSSYFPTRLLSTRESLKRVYFSTLFDNLVSVSVAVRDDLRVIQGSNDTTAPWRSPGSKSKSTKRIR